MHQDLFMIYTGEKLDLLSTTFSSLPHERRDKHRNRPYPRRKIEYPASATCVRFENEAQFNPGDNFPESGGSGAQDRVHQRGMEMSGQLDLEALVEYRVRNCQHYSRSEHSEKDEDSHGDWKVHRIEYCLYGKKWLPVN